MNKTEKMAEIKKLWKSKQREIQWEDIEWNPFKWKGRPFELILKDVEKDLKSEGYYFWSWGLPEEASGTVLWDWALLHVLHTWYSLPEDCLVPLFINEVAEAVCIPDAYWASRFALLFEQKDSVLMGMDNLDVEIAAAETAKKTKYEADVLAGLVPRPMTREEFLEVLNS